jgi:heme exporter protein B
MQKSELLNCKATLVHSEKLNVSYMRGFLLILKRDLQLAFKQPMATLEPVYFFLLVLLLFPLALGTKASLLSQVAISSIWIGALLASIIALNKLFADDFEDRTLEQFLISPYPFTLLIFAKIFAHWITSMLPLIFIAPVFAHIMKMPYEGYQALIVSLFLGTPILTLLGAIGAGITVSLRQSSLLLGLLILPLYTPVLIFAVDMVKTAQMQYDYSGQMSFLAAMLVLCITFVPWTVAATLKVSMN